MSTININKREVPVIARNKRIYVTNTASNSASSGSSSTPNTAGVTSFNSRTGAVTLSLADITGIFTGTQNGHNHTGVYDNYNSFNIYSVLTDTDYPVTSGMKVSLVAGTGIVIGEPVSLGGVVEIPISASGTGTPDDYVKWDLKVDSGAAMGIYKSGSATSYKGLDLVAGTNIALVPTSASDGFSRVTINSTADNYNRWKIAYYNSELQATSYESIYSSKSVEFVGVGGISIGEPSTTGDITTLQIDGSAILTKATIEAALTGDVTITGTNMITDDGGYAVKFTAGEALNRGEIVSFGTTDNTVKKAPANSDMPFGIVYQNASSGADVWIVVSGKAYVKAKGLVTLTRGDIVYVSDVAGLANRSATIPTSEHWREIGHCVSTGTASGLGLCLIHFN